MSASKPHISICIPTYNRADLIGHTLYSVTQQTVKPYEVLVIDNASSDNTEAVVKRFSSFGIQYIKNKSNIGMAGNYNRCIELTNSEYFTFLPSDDLIAPTWYEEWQNVIIQQKADLYTSPISIMDSHLRLIFAFPIFKSSRLIKQPDVMRIFMQHYTPMLVPSAATIFRKSIMKKIHPFDSAEVTECDVRPCMKLFDICNVYYHHSFLFVFREHNKRSFDTTKEERDNKFFERFERYLQIIDDIYTKQYKRDPTARFFIHGNIFMNLCNINLYVARGEIRKIITSYQLVHKYFPDLFQRSYDWPVFARYQWEFIKRALTMRRIPAHIRNHFDWLDDRYSFQTA